MAYSSLLTQIVGPLWLDPFFSITFNTVLFFKLVVEPL